MYKYINIYIYIYNSPIYKNGEQTKKNVLMNLDSRFPDPLISAFMVSAIIGLP